MIILEKKENNNMYINKTRKITKTEAKELIKMAKYRGTYTRGDLKDDAPFFDGLQEMFLFITGVIDRNQMLDEEEEPKNLKGLKYYRTTVGKYDILFLDDEMWDSSYVYEIQK